MDNVTEVVATNQSVVTGNNSGIGEPSFGDDCNNQDTVEGTFSPKWIVHVFFAVLVCGALVNTVVIFTLLRCRRNGTLCLLLQMSVIDILTMYVAALEITTVAELKWLFSNVQCQIFKGTEILTNTLLGYLIICVNFHVISLWNLHKSDRSGKQNPLTFNIEESDECLVTKNENANRIINIDYRKRKNDVSTIIPSITIWFLSLSLSLPTFALASSFKHGTNGNVICSMADFFHVRSLQTLLVTFKIIIPTVLLIMTALLLLYNIFRMSRKDIDSIFMKRLDELRVVLIFCSTLTALYMITSFQRNFFQLKYMLSIRLPFIDTDDFVSSFYQNLVSLEASVYLSMLHYCGPVLRGFLYLYMSPKHNWIRNVLFSCSTTD